MQLETAAQFNHLSKINNKCLAKFEWSFSKAPNTRLTQDETNKKTNKQSTHLNNISVKP